MDWLHRYHGSAPEGFEGQPILYMVTIFSLLLVNLLSLEWMWRLAWSIHERPLTIRHPGTTLRIVLFLLVFGGIVRSGPDLVWLVRWPDISVGERDFLLRIDAYMDTISFIPFSLAWLFAFLGGPMIVYQLSRHPLPLHLWPTFDQLKRPLKIGAGVAVICFALTFFP